MAIPIINDWEKFFVHPHEGLGSSYERVVLNDLLAGVVREYGIKTALESPSFGFTGLSGINLLAIADLGVEVTLEDDDAQRLELIKSLWQELGRPLRAVLNPGLSPLAYPDSAFDLSFSFSALWFAGDLEAFLKELARVTGKVIFISVPNRSGLGYKMQLRDYSPQKYPQLRLGNIDPPSIISILKKEGWKLRRSGCFDCPPWPDIGMTKEELLRKWFPKLPLPAPQPEKDEMVSILGHYRGQDPGFADRMRRYQWLEKSAPEVFKRIWAHHFYLVFDRR